MITLPNGKICMNEQEAIQWLLNNTPIPFQCSANYAAGTEIGLGTIVNPTPAKVKVGSIIFFADSKVSTVVGVTSNSFICSDQYNDLVDDVVYVSNVEINASGHLIVTLSNSNTIDAGLIKQISSFSINASQHLIASYNDGTNTDLGAIFSGNITISGSLSVVGGITGNSIIENMTGYSFNKTATLNWSADYVNVIKNGNKITFVMFGTYTYATGDVTNYLGTFFVPDSVYNQLYPYSLSGFNDVLSEIKGQLYETIDSAKDIIIAVRKTGGNGVTFVLRNPGSAGLTNGTTYTFRFEQTFLLGPSL